jgi:hypothetical protein
VKGWSIAPQASDSDASAATPAPTAPAAPAEPSAPAASSSGFPVPAVYPSHLDVFRCQSLHRFTALKGAQALWQGSYAPEIKQLLGPSPQGQDVLRLGEHLSAIFRSGASTPKGGPSASTAWEMLGVMYMNMVLHGTQFICATNVSANIPESIRRSMDLVVQGGRTNGGGGVVTFSVPESTRWDRTSHLKAMEQSIGNDPEQVQVAVVEFRTRFSDNAQIPMLWDWLYTLIKPEDIIEQGYRVGSRGLSPMSFGNFSYSFVTVPTNTTAPVTADALPAVRLSTLSGGAYWGKPTLDGVAMSCAEFFTTSLKDPFRGISAQEHIEANLLADTRVLDAYLNMDFSEVEQWDAPVRRKP